MPSGAKKRKAAKKKMETHPNPSPAPTQGSSDVKQQDDRHSDFGEASSTTSQEEKGVKIESEIVVPVEREFKNEEGEFDKKNGKSEHNETERKSYDGGSSESSSSSNSSSSDDESDGIKTSQAVVDTVPDSAKADHSAHVKYIEPVVSTTIGEGSDSVVDSIPPVVSDKVSLLSESLEVCTSSPPVVEPEFKESDEKKSTIDSKICEVEETDDRLSLSYNTPAATLDNEAETEKDVGVAKPLLVPPPRPVETTSWKSCCGLFELLNGSAR